MKVRDVKKILESLDDDLDVAVEQIFRENRSITLRSIEVMNGCVTFKDHNVRTSQHSEFKSFTGEVFEIPHEWECLTK